MYIINTISFCRNFHGLLGFVPSNCDPLTHFKFVINSIFCEYNIFVYFAKRKILTFIQAVLPT